MDYHAGKLRDYAYPEEEISMALSCPVPALDEGPIPGNQIESIECHTAATALPTFGRSPVNFPMS